MVNPFYLFIITLHISLYLKAAITQILPREGKSERKKKFGILAEEHTHKKEPSYPV